MSALRKLSSPARDMGKALLGAATDRANVVKASVIPAVSALVILVGYSLAMGFASKSSPEFRSALANPYLEGFVAALPAALLAVSIDFFAIDQSISKVLLGSDKDSLGAQLGQKLLAVPVLRFVMKLFFFTLAIMLVNYGVAYTSGRLEQAGLVAGLPAPAQSVVVETINEANEVIVRKATALGCPTLAQTCKLTLVDGKGLPYVPSAASSPAGNSAAPSADATASVSP